MILPKISIDFRSSRDKNFIIMLSSTNVCTSYLDIIILKANQFYT